MHGTIIRVTLSGTAARVMTLAQGGSPQEAVEIGRAALRDPRASLTEQAALWYVVAVAELNLGHGEAQIDATGRCLLLAREAGAAGWASNALSLRASGHVHARFIESALTDLVGAELELSHCQDEGLAGWAHTGLACVYLDLRLYELAEPHFEAALHLEASPMPLLEERAIDLANLAELHLRWAGELLRADPHEGSAGEAQDHLRRGHAFAVRALEEGRRAGAHALVALCHAIELGSRQQGDPAATIVDLDEAWRSDQHVPFRGSRAWVGATLARALWKVGRCDEALDVAREAAQESTQAGDWQITASVQWVLVEMEYAAGLPGAESGRAYALLMSRMLWQQRLSTLQGATAELDLERLRHDHREARQAALEDALTSVGNRRAVQLALTAPRRSSHPAPSDPGVRTTSLVLVDLDDFKDINDRHGHLIGDQVLRAVADALASVAREGDLVARLGGDEFVVVAHGTDAAAGLALAERVRTAVTAVAVLLPSTTITAEGVPGLHGRQVVGITASVGVHTTDMDLTPEEQLDAADRAMYADKRLRKVDDLTRYG